MKSSKHIGWGCLLAGMLGSGGASAWADSMNTLTQELVDTQAWREQAYWRVAMAPHTEHYRPSAEHQSVWAVALERQRRDGWLAGASRFSNSFGQPSAYVYVGHRFDGLLGQRNLYGQLSAVVGNGQRIPVVVGVADGRVANATAQVVDADGGRVGVVGFELIGLLAAADHRARAETDVVVVPQAHG